MDENSEINKAVNPTFMKGFGLGFISAIILLVIMFPIVTKKVG